MSLMQFLFKYNLFNFGPLTQGALTNLLSANVI